MGQARFKQKDKAYEKDLGRVKTSVENQKLKSKALFLIFYKTQDLLSFIKEFDNGIPIQLYWSEMVPFLNKHY